MDHSTIVKLAAAPICVKVVTCCPSFSVITTHYFRIGEELMAFLERHAPEYDRVVYVGDGSNDFCPVLRLRA